jgi:hypothetical protein
MGIMSVLAEMHASPDFKLNLKFEIEVLCRQLQLQLTVNDLRKLFSQKKKNSFVFLSVGSSDSSYSSE